MNASTEQSIIDEMLDLLKREGVRATFFMLG